MHDGYCSCRCRCGSRLLTSESKRLNKCTDCRIGNCKGYGLIESIIFKPNQDVVPENQEKKNE